MEEPTLKIASKILLSLLPKLIEPLHKVLSNQICTNLVRNLKLIDPVRAEENLILIWDRVVEVFEQLLGNEGALLPVHGTITWDTRMREVTTVETIRSDSLVALVLLLVWLRPGRFGGCAA